LVASAQANNIKSQSSMGSPNLQSGSTEQMKQGQIRKQRVTMKQRIGKSHLAMRHQPKGKIALAKLNRHHRIAIAQNHKLGKTRLATLNRHNRHQTVGVGSSTPSTGTNVMPQAPNQAPNSAGGTPSTNQ
jgi:hypothetical protein